MSWKLIEKTKKLLKEENGTIKKNFGGKISVALIYPNTYYLGMSNLGFQSLYYLFNNFPDIVCERGFLPSEEDLKEYQRTNTSLFSLESQKPINSFDIVAFSISFENDYLNLLRILKLSKIKIRTKERRLSDPLIIAGGIASTANPEPVAEFVDIFILGEAEEILEDFILNYKKARSETENKTEFLEFFNPIKEAYIPRFIEVDYNDSGTIKRFRNIGVGKEKVSVGKVKDLNKTETFTHVLTPATEFSNIYLIEVSRGCSRHCNFCLIGNLMGKGRFRDVNKVLLQIGKGLERTNKIGLLGSSISEHPEFDSLCRSLSDKEILPSISSIRFEGVRDPLLELLVKSGQNSLTLAPEAGSEAMRKLIGKPISEEVILEKTQYAIAKGILNLKLYFLIGLPGEKWDDIKAIDDLIKKIRHRIVKETKGKTRLGKIIVSINSFIPKPFTPFQWYPMEEVSSLNKKLIFLKKSLKGMSNISVITDVPKWSYVQAVLARGDRRVSDILIKTLELDGDWYRSFRELNINPDFYNYRDREEEELFPWDFIDNGFSKDSLLLKYRITKKEISA
ncbi:MAG: hypothetical protein A2149_01540 [Candidatus Schekmanbacteria bacterium RBG_16_38_11]|uniref:Radical SAM core domain-containing protein n=1 Tax=Candidatus Schekmanbacteria bacterium RBG_16_38_11 TaxID=1817880 RepID=A0A1F7RU90_9BACT|nr:MAG: hypothetical protein A2149_01540 [Candidatus Schekmanbacteria bacterium RBG_16_38_11]